MAMFATKKFVWIPQVKEQVKEQVKLLKRFHVLVVATVAQRVEV